MLRSAKRHNNSNIYFGLIYFICVILYSLVTFMDYFNRPVIETYSIIPSLNTMPISIDVSLRCSSKWPCSSCSGNWSSSGWICENGTVVPPTITEKYDRTKPGYCDGIASNASIWPTAESTNFSVTSCYSADFNDGILIRVPFTGTYAAGSSPRMFVVVTKQGSDLYYEQQLEPAQRKSVFLGQTVNKHYNDPTSYDTYDKDFDLHKF